MTPNSMTSIAMHNGKPLPARRPTFVDWTMRILECALDARTDRGDVDRLMRAASDILPPQTVMAISATVRACIAEMKKGAAAATDPVPPEAA